MNKDLSMEGPELSAFLEELEKIAKLTKKERIGLGIGAGALGAAVGAAAFLSRKPHLRGHLGYKFKSILKGESTTAKEFSKALPEAVVRDAKAMAAELNRQGLDPSKMRIAVSGTGGTGKTTFSRALAKELGVKSVHLDKTRVSWKGRDLTKHPIMSGKPEGGVIYEQTHLLNQVDPDKFDAIIRIHRPMKTVEKQLKARKRGAYQWDFYDYPMLHKAVHTAFNATKGEAVDVTKNLSVKVKPKGGFMANAELNKQLVEMGILEKGLDRQQKVLSAATGRKVTTPGVLPYIKGKTVATMVGLSAFGAGTGVASPYAYELLAGV